MSWKILSKWWGSAAKRSSRGQRRRFARPSLELLEGRTLPAVITPFTSRFSANDTGDIAFVANTVVRADPNDADAANAQNGTLSGSANNNNGHTMVNVDVDSDTTTFNSSRATLNLPAGATVLFAGLYWGAESDYSANRDKVKFDTPATTGYVDLDGVAIGSTDSDDYQGFIDVTNLVKAAGNGSYTVANVQADVGTDKHGGWALVIDYSDPAAPARHLT